MQEALSVYFSPLEPREQICKATLALQFAPPATADLLRYDPNGELTSRLERKIGPTNPVMFKTVDDGRKRASLLTSSSLLFCAGNDFCSHCNRRGRGERPCRTFWRIL